MCCGMGCCYEDNNGDCRLGILSSYPDDAACEQNAEPEEEEDFEAEGWEDEYTPPEERPVTYRFAPMPQDNYTLDCMAEAQREIEAGTGIASFVSISA